ncbi:hypothetical protein VNO78_30675 [Psophocarpus tetragonolobus]|uniref:Uncharacterized protein n=1 Tax=Psophocarpus tetragonolobus TaxID=3891 RepID=A0AAN9RXS7_PSOTE
MHEQGVPSDIYGQIERRIKFTMQSNEGDSMPRKPYDQHEWALVRLEEMTCKTQIRGGFSNNIGRKLRSGEDTLFWQDNWLGEDSLTSLFPRLYELALQKRPQLGIWEGLWRGLRLFTQNRKDHMFRIPYKSSTITVNVAASSGSEFSSVVRMKFDQEPKTYKTQKLQYNVFFLNLSKP